jgi:hypothetical protein
MKMHCLQQAVGNICLYAGKLAASMAYDTAALTMSRVKNPKTLSAPGAGQHLPAGGQA